jgi:hypothetical protein
MSDLPDSHHKEFLSIPDIDESYLFDEKIFDIDGDFSENKRKTVRYVRKDISAFISQADIFGTYSLFSHSRSIRVRLLDISCKGSLIASPKKLNSNRKFRLTLVFNSNKKFEISAKIVRELTRNRSFYGLKFDSINNELGDYLLESETQWNAY